jgi:hypothetical protein
MHAPRTITDEAVQALIVMTLETKRPAKPTGARVDGESPRYQCGGRCRPAQQRAERNLQRLRQALITIGVQIARSVRRIVLHLPPRAHLSRTAPQPHKPGGWPCVRSPGRIASDAMTLSSRHGRIQGTLPPEPSSVSAD